MDNECPQGPRRHPQAVRQCRRQLTRCITATRRWPPALALVARSLALEWSSLDLGPGAMAMAMVVASVPQPYVPSRGYPVADWRAAIALG